VAGVFGGPDSGLSVKLFALLIIIGQPNFLVGFDFAFVGLCACPASALMRQTG